jgi:hypothetical protein
MIGIGVRPSAAECCFGRKILLCVDGPVKLVSGIEPPTTAILRSDRNETLSIDGVSGGYCREPAAALKRSGQRRSYPAGFVADDC